MLHEEMIANGIKSIFVQACETGLFEALIEFEVEYLVTQGLGGANLVWIIREPCGVVSR